MSRSVTRSVVVLALALLVVAVVAAPVSAKRAKVDMKNMRIQLGAAICFDTNLSEPAGQACDTCHDPKVGFGDPDKQYPVSEGVIAGMFGGRNAPTWAYTAWSPTLHHDVAQGLWVGGMFWDGSATGWRLGLPLAEQAQGPFLNPVEMHNTSPDEVIRDISTSSYADLFLRVYPDTDWTDVGQAYDDMAFAIASYESSRWVNSFKSRFDAWMGGDETLTAEEHWGFELFNGKGTCSQCHPSAPTMQSTGLATSKALFTDYTYDNLGLPANPEVWALHGSSAVDYGLGGFLRSAGYDEAIAAAEDGKFKVPTLRNIAKTAPYGHNGYFDTLYDVVHFYNTRDVPGADWPAPEVSANINAAELGNLHLTYDEEMAIVAFLETLTDSPVLPPPVH